MPNEYLSLPRIDGIDQTDDGNKPFLPEGIMYHSYYPPDLVIIKMAGNDLEYMTSYWQVEQHWKYHLPKQTFDMLLARFLSSEEVILDYTPGDYKVFVAKDNYKDGFILMYRECVDALYTLDSVEFAEQANEIGRSPEFPLTPYRGNR
jgi:hypothetical protein